MVMPQEPCVFPVSFAQQRLWFLDRVAPGNPFYNIPLAVPVRVALDVPSLERALNAVVARHEVLRTTFRVVNGEPCQIVHPSLELKVHVTDLRCQPPAEREARTQRLATEEACNPFELERGPLLRCSVVTRGLFDHVLLLSLHHIISDGWSMGILARELTALYQAFVLGRQVALPDLPIQYADFAVWQRDSLRGEILEEQLGYWCKQLADLPALELSTDRPRPPVLTYRGSFHPVSLTSALSHKIRALARAQNATPFMLLTAAFAILLQRYSGQQDIVIGTPVANRNRAEIEGLIGFFVNSLVLRVNTDGDPSFTELLARVYEVCLGAYAHQDLPFERLVEQLQPPRDPSRNPLFQVTLQLVNTPTLQDAPSRAEGPTSHIHRGSAIFDIAFTLLDSPGAFSGIVEYSTDLFDTATIERMDGHFQHILECVVADPQVRTANIRLLSPGEKAEVLRLSHGPLLAVPDKSFVHQVIRNQAKRTPDAVAVQFRDAKVPYRDLVAYSRRLAGRLSSMGVRGEIRVGILMDRSPGLVVSLLAVLEAGGVFVPLDPSYPAERLKYMVKDAGVKIVLTDSVQLELATSITAGGAALLSVDAEMASDEFGYAVIENQLSQDDLAYILYTSGSTGLPKGVAISHRALANHMVWMLGRFPLAGDDRVLQRTPYSFDASVWEFFAPLMAGARLVLLPPEAQKNPELIVDCMADCGVTTVQFVPSLLQVVLDEPQLYTCLSLRRIFSGGEALTDELRETVKRSLDVELVNLYGPTEATIDATFFVCGNQREPFGVPVGHPVANLNAYVLDASLEPTPIGVGGELYLAGAGLARGYIDRPALTAERFLPDIYGTVPGSRMYRTGDLVRRTQDGTLLYLGRVDEQVKVRGYRIELGEIETAIRNVPGVQSCAVVAQGGQSSGPTLTAFIVASSEEAEAKAAEPLGDAGLELVSRWEGVYEHIYSALFADTDGASPFLGWNSSYTGSPVDAEDMDEWLMTTLERIRKLGPVRVLEIGCGTGLLLTQLAPDCEFYAGADFSPSVMRYLESRIRTLPNRGANVELIRRRADDLNGVPEHSFNAVVLNSVIQYFPNLDYLMRVMRSAARAVAPGGRIFVGDVRSLPLLEAFELSKALHKVMPRTDSEGFLDRVRLEVEEEQELLIDPRLFYSMASELGATATEIQLKRGRHSNELTRFRYDVVLRIGDVHSNGACSRFDWVRDGFTLERLRSLMEQEKPDRLIVEGVPNGRVLFETTLLERLNSAPAHSSIDGLCWEAQTKTSTGIHPEDFWQAAAGGGYEARICFSEYPRVGSFDVVLSKAGVTPAPDPAGEHVRTQQSAWHQYVNNPLRSLVTRHLAARVREALSRQLPDYMVPSAFVLLDALPLLPNGKLNRKAFPTRRGMRHDEAAYVAPRTALEQALATVWAEVLEVNRVGIRDDFFTDLGGHSLLATQLISRIREALPTDVPLKEIFKSPTIEQFSAALIERDPDKRQALEITAGLVVKLGHMSEVELDAALYSSKANHA
jgi:amino acid adenylation domain-containing protein